MVKFGEGDQSQAMVILEQLVGENMLGSSNILFLIIPSRRTCHTLVGLNLNSTVYYVVYKIIISSLFLIIFLAYFQILIGLF